MCVALHLYAMVGKHMSVVFDMLAEFVSAGVFQPGLEFDQHVGQRQLGRRVWIRMRQRNVGGFTRCDAEADANDLGTHLVERGGFGVDGHQVGGLNFCQPLVEGVPGQEGVVAQGADRLD